MELLQVHVRFVPRSRLIRTKLGSNQFGGDKWPVQMSCQEVQSISDFWRVLEKRLLRGLPQARQDLRRHEVTAFKSFYLAFRIFRKKAEVRYSAGGVPARDGKLSREEESERECRNLSWRDRSQRYQYCQQLCRLLEVKRYINQSSMTLQNILEHIVRDSHWEFDREHMHLLKLYRKFQKTKEDAWNKQRRIYSTWYTANWRFFLLLNKIDLSKSVKEKIIEQAQSNL